MKYICIGCGYIYNEAEWEREYGVPPCTLHTHLPDDFFCPVCQEYHKDDFIALDEPILPLPTYHPSLQLFEKEHIPLYEKENNLLHIFIGYEKHPMEKNHCIYKIGLYDESGDEIDEKILHIWEEPTAVFDIEYMEQLEIRIFCSKHGIFSTGMIDIHQL